jgi:uncharacterized protein
MIFLISLLLFLFIIEYYAFQALKTTFNNKILMIVYAVVNFSTLIFVVYSIITYDRSMGPTKQSLFVLGLALLLFVPKIVIALFLGIEDVFRFFEGCIKHFTDEDKIKFLHQRRGFISKIALGVAAIPFLSLIYGMTIGKYNFKVIKQRIFFDDLPDEFDGFTITQISDIHSGSFDNKEKIEYAIDLINEQKSDILLFTGDIVNNFASEMDEWIDTFKGINEHKYGKYSVLGNHDYGLYVDWKSDKEIHDNFDAIKNIHKKINFSLLQNENVQINKGNQKINLIGVKNWGKGFNKGIERKFKNEIGDLVKASEGLNESDFKILMSHDPSHWENQVKNNKTHYHLTLSGHTHGLQFGIEIPGWIKWSPVQYVYKQWAGLYQNKGRYVYVNRGFGFHAYPGRVGIMPEITVIELKKSPKKA